LRLNDCDNLTDDAEAWQDHDVNLGMTEEPEQVLEQQRVSATSRTEKRGAEVAIRQRHSHSARQYWQHQQ
jgi:hypothetical protein